VTVQVSYGPSQLRLTVRNTPPGQAVDAFGRAVDASGQATDASRLAETGSGLGIVQLRQRVELVHGTLRAGPAQDGGFCVEATLPAYVPTAESVASA
jgi:signal transduction histidine kinase